jgi:hypothetical protein
VEPLRPDGFPLWVSGAGPGSVHDITAARGWAQVLTDRIETLRRQAERIEAARRHLEHILTFHHDSPPDDCPHYEALIWQANPGNGQPGHTQP